MILKSLKLENFLSHTDSFIEFYPDGITAIIGENGAGKSSIIEAIHFALFGKSDKGNIANLVQWGKREAKVELEFQKGNNTYKIVREIKLTGKKAETNSYVQKLEKGKYVLYYQKNINKELPKLTGLTNKIFSNSVLVKQGEIEGLLNLSSKERAKVFKDLLDMSLYQLLSEKYGEKRKNIEKVIEGIQSSLPDEEELQNKIKILEKEKESLIQEEEKIQKQIKKLKETLENIEEQIQKREKQLKENEKRKINIKNIEEKIKEKQSIIK